MQTRHPHTEKSAAMRDRLRSVEFIRRDGQGCILPYAGLHIDYWRGPMTEILVQSPERDVMLRSREAGGIIEGLKQRRIAVIAETGALPEARPESPEGGENAAADAPDTAYPVVEAIAISPRR